jgi:hypothetical protein
MIRLETVAAERGDPGRGVLQPGRSTIRSALYSEAAFNLVGLAFDARPFDRLIIVAATERHFLAADRDNNIAPQRIAMTPYPHFSGLFSDR